MSASSVVAKRVPPLSSNAVIVKLFVSHLSPQEHAQVVRLVGRKCIVKCLLNGLETDALWDTGAQVSIISHSWLNQCLPGCDIRDIAELLGMDGLKLKAANGTDLPYEGWVELTFNLIEDDSDHTVTVPFLIAKDFLDILIVGFNVIEERQVFFAGCRLKFHYNWKTAGTKKKGKAIDLP